jgi:ABC-type multidrug transport system ATPase subunit
MFGIILFIILIALEEIRFKKML